MISQDVFKNASQSIQDESWQHVGWLLGRALGLAIVVAGLLRLLWRKTTPPAQPVPEVAS
jgi:cytochrome b561